MADKERTARIKKLDLNKSEFEPRTRTPMYSIIIEAADIFLGKIKYRAEDRLLRIIHLNHQ